MTSDGISLPLILTIPFAGIIGLFVGSFLNVVIYRAPRGLSVASPRSFCPTCRSQLSWWENIPVASWAGLRGRCRNCRQPISVRYPLVELTTGALFSLVTWGWHGTVVSAGYCVLAGAMVAVILIEYGGIRAPLSVAAIGTGAAQLTILVGAGWQHHWEIVLGSIIGSLIAVVAFAVLRTFDPECKDPRGFGRSALLMAGCWLGGLGAEPAFIGVVVWIIACFVCMIGAWSLGRRPGSEPETAPSWGRVLHPIMGTPLITALAVAMAASLIARG
jgi:leader peptidase (prepilin peptidase)/N-methyltransferase